MRELTSSTKSRLDGGRRGEERGSAGAKTTPSFSNPSSLQEEINSLKRKVEKLSDELLSLRRKVDEIYRHSRVPY